MIISIRPFSYSWLGLVALTAALVSAACNGQERRASVADTVLSNGDWPQWRGPNRDGLSGETGLLKEWPEDGPPVVWKATGIGEGFSSVSVVANRVYTMGDLDDGCYLFSLNRQNGDIVWKKKVGKTGGNYKGPRCTPTVERDRVYALGQFGDLLCCEQETGEIVWHKNLVHDFKGDPGGWNYTESPLVDGERLICTPGGKEATMIALHKQTGDVLWKGKTEEGESAAYASPVIAEIGGVRQYVQLLSQGGASFAAEDGKLLWRYGDRRNRFASNTANIPTPIVHGDRVFFAAGYGRGGGMIRVTKEGGDFQVEELWFNQKLNNKHGGVIWVGDYLYGGRDDSPIAWCADSHSGDILWEKRSSNDGSGSISVTYADGNLYWRYANGVVSLVPASPDGFNETSSFKIAAPSGEPSWPHPVVAGGQFYLRDQDTLWCYDVRAK